MHTRALAIELSQGQEHQPLSPEGVPRAATVRRRPDRLGEVRASGTVPAGAVRVCAMPRIAQRGQADHPVNSGGTGGKGLEGGEASSARGVGKRALSQTTKKRYHAAIGAWQAASPGGTSGGHSSRVPRVQSRHATGRDCSAAHRPLALGGASLPRRARSPQGSGVGPQSGVRARSPRGSGPGQGRRLGRK
jgi:hypothetical protein